MRFSTKIVWPSLFVFESQGEMSKFYLFFICFRFSRIFSGNKRELICVNSYSPTPGKNYLYELRLLVCCLQRHIQNPVKHLKMEPFAKKVQLLTLFAKSFILDVLQCSEYASRLLQFTCRVISETGIPELVEQ